MKRILCVLALALLCSISNLPPTAASFSHAKGMQVTRKHHRHRRFPAWWLGQAHCIHWHEAVSGSTPTRAQLRQGWRIHWHLTTVYGSGEPSGNRGGFQIAFSTWASYAPHGYPSDPARATRWQQVRVAHRIWVANGDRWGGSQWPGTAAACGIQ